MNLTSNNKYKSIFFIIVSLLVWSNFAFTDILTIYSDVGISGNDVYTWTDGGSFDSNHTGITPVPEDTKCYKTISTGTYAGWGVFYSTEQNFSNYQGGDLRFWIYSTTGNIKVEIERWNGQKSTKYLTDYGWNDSYVNTWKLFKIPLNDFALDITTSVKSPFEITVSTPATFYVDLVRWTTGVALPDIQMKIKRISDNVVVSSITWDSVTLPTNWAVADCYLELEVDQDTMTWGVQIYTDNMSEDANPQYTGTANPVGLVDTTTTTKVLPTAWTIEDSTKTMSELGTGQPNTWVTGGDMWKWMKDKNTEGFTNGEYYITVWSNKGILWGSASNDRAWKNSPNYIYISADFSYAVTPRTYKTNQLKIELYYE